MPAKSRDEPDILRWLYERGEETVGQVLRDLARGRSLGDGVSKMVERAAKTKGRMDKNTETILHLLNLPSRADYNKLLLKIEHLQGSVVNLSMKLDRLLAAQERKKIQKLKVES
ncbi:MAG: hypothetical protein ABSA52_23530 [Candidatus Binatia bacterium]|jgi:hypothetical protein